MLAPDDRLLVVTPPEAGEVAGWVATLSSGTLVLLAGDDDLYLWREQLARHENVMVTPGSRDEIPWADGCFTVIVDRSGLPPTAEMTRVLAPGRGRIVT